MQDLERFENNQASISTIEHHSCSSLIVQILRTCAACVYTHHFVGIWVEKCILTYCIWYKICEEGDQIGNAADAKKNTRIAKSGRILGLTFDWAMKNEE